MPDFKRVANAYGIESMCVGDNSEIVPALKSALASDRPVLCELMIDPEQQLICTQGFKANPDGTYSPRPLEDMNPPLDRKRFRDLMVVEPLAASCP